MRIFEGIIVLAVLIGVVGVGIALLAGVIHLLSSMGRGRDRPFRGEAGADSGVPADTHFAETSARAKTRLCHNEQCRHRNVAGANFCARCGKSLSGTRPGAAGGLTS